MGSEQINRPLSRRGFLRSSIGSGVACAVVPNVSVPYFLTGGTTQADEDKATAKNDRHVIGSIGTGSRWGQVISGAMEFGDVVAVCDVDEERTEQANKRVGGKSDVFGDYRHVLDRKDVDVVTIMTPDHWHAKIAIEAMLAGKDVYCEPPISLTIDEGKKICRVAEETGRIFQVGTQQRSEMANRFLIAVAMCREGRLGKLRRVTCSIGSGLKGAVFKQVAKPAHLNWERWLGQAPLVPYVKERCHYTFRWWYDYSGGILTDWGAHHVDIAQWAIGEEAGGPIRVEGKGVFSSIAGSYDTPLTFEVKCDFLNDVEMIIRSGPGNGIEFEGDSGTIFVDRGKLFDKVGKQVQTLKESPILSEYLVKELRSGKALGSHMANFFHCVRLGGKAASDVFSHHRSISTCHLANLALRLQRPIDWDPAAEQSSDSEVNAMLVREQRKGYEVTL